LTRWLASASLAGALLLALPSAASAADLRTGDTIVVAAGETVNDDVYAFGNNVLIHGTVFGDVIAAGNSVTITGHVTGDVVAGANTIVVNGPVDGSVRVGGNLLTLSGPVGEDVLMGGSMLSLTSAGRVGRDFIGGGNSLSVQGPVARNLKAGGGTLMVSSTVGGALEAEVTDLVLESGAVVRGPVSYTSGRDASVSAGARIEGPIQRTSPAPRPERPWAPWDFDLLGLLRGFVGLAALGAVFALLFPRATTTVGETAQRQWLGSLGLGLALLAGIPMLALLVFVVGLIVGGWWIALMLLSAYVVLAVFGYLAAAESAGSLTARLANWQLHPAWSLVLGVVVLGLLTLLPVIGPIIGFIAVVFGLGALGLAAWHAYRGTVPVPTPGLAAPVPAPVPAGA
jgi:cytoskeletal protein CcmA (bactofilin family)